MADQPRVKPSARICDDTSAAAPNPYPRKAMNVARQRTLNVLAGVAFTLLGFACYGAAGYLAFVPPAPVGDAPLMDANTTDCQRTLTEIGLTSFKIGPELR